MIALRDSTKTKLTAVLTADELQKLRDATAGHRMYIVATGRSRRVANTSIPANRARPSRQ